MATPKSPSAKPKRSKAEVKREFEEIVEEVAAAKEASTAKAEAIVKQKEQDIRQVVSDLTVEGVAQGITGLNVEISRFLSGLSDKLVREVNTLASVREAIALEQTELEKLHKIDVATTALDMLVKEYQQQKEILEVEIAAAKAAWTEQDRQRERDQKEYEDTLKKQRQREVEEYEYKKALDRKKAQDKYEEEMRLLEKKNRERQDTLEKSWQSREAELKEKEAAFARLSKEVEEFPGRLQREVQQAVAGAVQSVERRHEQQIALLAKDAETERRVAALQVTSLQETVSRQLTYIESVEKRLEEAKRQVQEIAVKAIEGASGAKALAHIEQIAMEQAKTRTQP
ncbi:MAG: hypothetical protein KGL31_04385 [candidate division NC10 bacterium]|nr:hypothetical protein [candidate division NC10 bacterium]MDE2321140.1 hypothetical protein [candidate division NC10 bacterium]